MIPCHNRQSRVTMAARLYNPHVRRRSAITSWLTSSVTMNAPHQRPIVPGLPCYSRRRCAPLSSLSSSSRRWFIASKVLRCCSSDVQTSSIVHAYGAGYRGIFRKYFSCMGEGSLHCPLCRRLVCRRRQSGWHWRLHVRCIAFWGTIVWVFGCCWRFEKIVCNSFIIITCARRWDRFEFKIGAFASSAMLVNYCKLFERSQFLIFFLSSSLHLTWWTFLIPKYNEALGLNSKFDSRCIIDEKKLVWIQAESFYKFCQFYITASFSRSFFAS